MPDPEEKQPTTPAGGSSDKKKPIIYSLRPKSEYETFLADLVKEKGGAQQALEHCVRIAMNPPKPAPSAPPAPAPPKPATGSSIILTPDETAKLEKIQKAKNKAQREALNYAIVYTAKNDWI
jgi:hypothetical protein